MDDSDVEDAGDESQQDANHPLTGVQDVLATHQLKKGKLRAPVSDALLAHKGLLIGSKIPRSTIEEEMVESYSNSWHIELNLTESYDSFHSA